MNEKLKYIIIIIVVLFFIYYTFFLKVENFTNEDNGYIILELFQVNEGDMGGFYWWVHNAACCLKLCEMTNKKPLLLFNKGYYYDKTKNNKSWWNNYFKAEEISDDVHDWYLKNINSYRKVRNIKLNDKESYVYDMISFQKVMRNLAENIHTEYGKSILLKDDLQKKIDDIYIKNNPNKYKQIGIHYRGTDKFFGNGDQEDLETNRHLDYETVYNLVINDINNKNYGNIVIFIASDEQPFINYMKTRFNNQYKVYVYEECFRSDHTTSGIELEDTSHCNVNDKSPECVKWKEYSEKSIHKGHQHISPYKKGEDAIIDVWLLSKSDVFYQTHGGNFASHPKRINQKLEEIKLF